MTNINKNTSKNDKNKSGINTVATAIGLTGGLIAATLGANLLFNTKKGKSSLKHIKSFAFKMKGEALEKLEKAKEVSEEGYHKAIDEITEKYKKIKGMTIEEVVEVANELKSGWKKAHVEAKKMMKPVAKTVKKTVKTIKNEIK